MPYDLFLPAHPEERANKPGRRDGRANAFEMRLLMDPFMYHGPCTVYHVGNLASCARGVAEQEQGEFLKRRGFGSGKVLRWTLSCTIYRCTVYHVGNLASFARGVAEHKPRRIFGAMRFWERKGFEMDQVDVPWTMYRVPCRKFGELCSRNCEA